MDTPTPDTPTLHQKILFAVLCGLILLLALFSFIAAKDKNYEGFKKCVDAKCQRGGEKFCSKFREINNCCLGAGGNIAAGTDNQYTCIFDKPTK